MAHTGAVGNLNGTWSLLFKAALASYPFVVTFIVWLGISTVQNNEFRKEAGPLIDTMELQLAAMPEKRLERIEDKQDAILEKIQTVAVDVARLSAPKVVTP